MKHGRGRVLWKVPLIGLGLVALCLGVCLALTDADPATLPLRAWRWVVVRTRRPPAPRPAAARPDAEEPPFSDINFDDSGYATAIRFSKPITDPTSLTQIRESVVGRGQRGITYLEDKLASLPPGDPATPSTTANIHLIIGSLLMYDGRWQEAGAEFAQAQDADPARSSLARANMDALRGVAALRRGEIENCVACCNEASCIFPLAASAVHQRTAGSREAIEHFTRYLRQRPEDLGVRWLLNVAYMTLGEYPERVPPRFLLPLGRFATTGDSPHRMVNVASRVGLNAAR